MDVKLAPADNQDTNITNKCSIEENYENSRELPESHIGNEPGSSVCSYNSSQTIPTSSAIKKTVYVKDVGPKFYDVKGNVVTGPMVLKNLPDMFEGLPIFGKPNSKNELKEFQWNQIRDFVGCKLNSEEFDKLSKYCSPDHLKTGHELVMLTNMPTHGYLPTLVDKHFDTKLSDIGSTGRDLCTQKKYKMRMEKDYAETYMRKLKYRGVRMIPLSQTEENIVEDTEVETLQPGKDTLFRIRVYRPYSYSEKHRHQRASLFSCDVVVAGRRRLSALRERLACPNDADMRVDVSHRPNDLPVATAKEVFPSGFLFINNTFYVDYRPGCTDQSEVTRAWAKRKGYGDFPVKDMDRVTLDEMVIKLGHPEVYVHQGNCEHLFTFSEVRLLNWNDPLNMSHYPCSTALSQYQSIYCTTCAEFAAKWVVVGCPKVPFDPAYFCEVCFKSYLYKDGKKICDFKAYSYKGNELNLLKPQL